MLLFVAVFPSLFGNSLSYLVTQIVTWQLLVLPDNYQFDFVTAHRYPLSRDLSGTCLVFPLPSSLRGLVTSSSK